MGYAVERIFLPVMKMQYPEIVDVAMPAEGIFHNLMIVAIRKSYPGHARKIMNAIWSLGQAMFTKVIVVVDHDVNVHDYREVVWKALCALDPERDVQFSLGPGRYARSRPAHAGLRLENGRRRHAQMAHRRFYAPVAGRNPDGRQDQSQNRFDLENARPLKPIQTSTVT